VHRTGESIDSYMDRRTLDVLRLRFDYIFASSADPESLYRPLLRDHVIDGPFRVGPFEILPFEQNHGPETSLGFRIGPFAYSTDVKMLDEAAFAALEGVKIWVVDCLRDRPHPTHSHVSQTFAWIERLRPERAVLTHMNQDIDYQDLKDRCPPGVEPGYDGMILEVPLL
ncbi:MAG TPA: MBL fold metallo-hydrolase, partial [Kiloniellaceae bacterium]|nr:MBL fold metallo-hydrolase [Kiloniellaceae bacterium]